MDSFDNKFTLYIPRIYKHAHKKSACKNIVDFVQQEFTKSNFGIVECVNLRPIWDDKMKLTNYYYGFVHFSSWNDTPENRKLQEEIVNSTKGGKPVKWYINKKNYWILGKNTSKSVKQPNGTFNLDGMPEGESIPSIVFNNFEIIKHQQEELKKQGEMIEILMRDIELLKQKHSHEMEELTDKMSQMKIVDKVHLVERKRARHT